MKLGFSTLGCPQWDLDQIIDSARANGYDGARAMAFARSAGSPLLAALGRLERTSHVPSIAVDPARAVATCLKPADGDPAGGFVLRVWEVAGRPGPLPVGVSGYRTASEVDLLERLGRPLSIHDGRVSVELRPRGLAAVRLAP